jgi:gamma-glutamylcyclotransferase (GGCT)/AIG2-like uncharacterized protein YtfP
MAQHVFVYGSLKRGLHNCHLLAEAEFVGQAETFEPDFRMGNVGSYPEITRLDSEAAGYVLGEVYLCDQPTMARLDRLEGSSYQRELIVTRLIRAASDANVTAWTYLWRRKPCPVVEPVGMRHGKPVYEWRGE